MSTIVDIFREIVKDVSDQITPCLQKCDLGITGVYYDHGHLLEVNDTLVSKEKTIAWRDKKYPIIILTQDFDEDRGESTGLRLIIAHNTKGDIRASERYEKVFKPILIPIYNQLIESIVWSGKFFWEGDMTKPPHTKTDRPFLGESGRYGNVKYIMDDKLDAIEITNLTINYRYNKC